jgi:hypothetical protein
MARKAPAKPDSLKVDKVSSPPKGKHGGARPGAGRASRAAILGVKELFEECWPQEERERTIRSLSEQAVNGSIEAAKLLFGYWAGRPKELKEVTGADGGAIRVVVAYEDRPIDDKG